MPASLTAPHSMAIIDHVLEVRTYIQVFNSLRDNNINNNDTTESVRAYAGLVRAARWPSFSFMCLESVRRVTIEYLAYTLIVFARCA